MSSTSFAVWCNFDKKFAFPEHDMPSVDKKHQDPFFDEKKKPSPLEKKVEKTAKTRAKKKKNRLNTDKWQI